MPRFMMAYKGEATDLSEMTGEEAQAVMAKWCAWTENLGPALVDIGMPFGPAASIVEVSDLDAAAQLSDGHPYVSEGSGTYATPSR